MSLQETVKHVIFGVKRIEIRLRFFPRRNLIPYLLGVVLFISTLSVESETYRFLALDLFIIKSLAPHPVCFNRLFTMTFIYKMQ